MSALRLACIISGDELWQADFDCDYGLTHHEVGGIVFHVGEEESKSSVGPFDVGKVEKEIEWFRRLKKRSPRLFWAIIVFLFGSLALNLFDRFDGMPDLKKENREYKDENVHLHGKLAEANADVLKLEAELTPFRIYAIGKYGGEEKQALDKLVQEIAEVPSPGSNSIFKSLAPNAPIKAAMHPAYYQMKEQEGFTFQIVSCVKSEGKVTVEFVITNTLDPRWIEIYAGSGVSPNAAMGMHSASKMSDDVNREFFGSSIKIANKENNGGVRLLLTPRRQTQCKLVFNGVLGESIEISRLDVIFKAQGLNGEQHLIFTNLQLQTKE